MHEPASNHFQAWSVLRRAGLIGAASHLQNSFGFRPYPSSERAAPFFATGMAESTSTSASASLDHKTLQFLEHLHHAWSTQASSSVYTDIRDELLLQRDKLDARVSALSTVARIACPDAVDADLHWQELFTLAESIEDDGKKRKRRYQEANRFRNYVVVVALWSSQVVLHYGWDKVGQAQMYMIRACATEYPRFKENLCPRLNCVLLERHRQSIRYGRLRTLNEVSIQPSRDLALHAYP